MRRRQSNSLVPDIDAMIRMSGFDDMPAEIRGAAKNAVFNWPVADIRIEIDGIGDPRDAAKAIARREADVIGRRLVCKPILGPVTAKKRMRRR